MCKEMKTGKSRECTASPLGVCTVGQTKNDHSQGIVIKFALIYPYKSKAVPKQPRPFRRPCSKPFISTAAAI